MGYTKMVRILTKSPHYHVQRIFPFKSLGADLLIEAEGTTTIWPWREVRTKSSIWGLVRRLVDDACT